MAGRSTLPRAQRIPAPRRLAAAGCLALAAACAGVPPDSALSGGAALLQAQGAPAARDGRAGFRSTFCATLARGTGTGAPPADCGQFLWRVDDEAAPGAPAPPVAPPPAADLRVYVVGGAFSDCFGDASVAFREGIERLSARGVTVSAIAIEGRSGARRNASLIAERLRSDAPPVGSPVILIGYSKGAVDILHLIADHPVEAERVDAVVSVAGPVRGSALADRGAWLYDHALARGFDRRCPAGDGGVIDSLETATRLRWLAERPLPPRVRFYTLSAFTTREHLARALRPSWSALARTEARNDGQVTVSESLLPGSTLLGYVNADHWTVAIDIEAALPTLAARPDARPFPRAALFEAIVDEVAGDLARASGQDPR